MGQWKFIFTEPGKPEGELSLDDLAWRDGFSEWVSLKELLAEATPPPLPMEPPTLSSAPHAPRAKVSPESNKGNDNPQFPEPRKKASFGSFFNRLLGKRDFASYEEVPAVFYRFGDSKEYGPVPLDRVLTFFRNKEREISGRFVDDKSWRSPSYFFDLWFRVLPSAHTRFKDYVASRPSSHQRAEILRMSVIDTSLS